MATAAPGHSICNYLLLLVYGRIRFKLSVGSCLRATSWTEGHIYLFSSFMAVVFYFMYRGPMKNLKA